MPKPSIENARVGWGVIGTGAIAARFCADMRYARFGRIAGIASRDPARARAFAATLGPGVMGGDVDAMLADPAVTAVYVASPTAQHAGHAIAAIRTGKPVLVEKPLAGSATEAERIAEAAERAGILCMEAMWMRFTPGVVAAKRAIEAGRIGTPHMLDAQLAYANPYDPASRLFDPTLGGGAHLDLGVYPLSLAFHLLGAPSGAVHTAVHAPNGVPAAGGLVLTYPDAVASLGFGFLAEGRNDASIAGSAGRLRLQAPFLCPPSISVKSSARPALHDAADTRADAPSRQRAPSRLPAFKAFLRQWRERPIPTLYEGSGLQYQADHFAELLAEGRTDSSVMPMAQSIEILRLLDRFGPAFSGRS